MLTRLGEALGELIPNIGDDLREAVVGGDVAELLVGRAAGTALSGLPGLPPGLRTGSLRLLAGALGFAQLPLDVPQPVVEPGIVGGSRWRRRRSVLAELPDLRVRLLDGLEPACGLDRAAVVIGMVQPNHAPVG